MHEYIVPTYLPTYVVRRTCVKEEGAGRQAGGARRHIRQAGRQAGKRKTTRPWSPDESDFFHLCAKKGALLIFYLFCTQHFFAIIVEYL